MPEKIMAITATKVIPTGKISFRFMVDSKPPRDGEVDVIDFDEWGLLELQKKSDDHFAPFEWAKCARGEPHKQFIGDDGVKRWNVNVFKGGSGLTMAAGIDDEKPDSLDRLLADAPDCCLLMEDGLLQRVQEACERMGVQLFVHRSGMELPTS